MTATALSHLHHYPERLFERQARGGAPSPTSVRAARTSSNYAQHTMASGVILRWSQVSCSVLQRPFRAFASQNTDGPTGPSLGPPGQDGALPAGKGRQKRSEGARAPSERGSEPCAQPCMPVARRPLLLRLMLCVISPGGFPERVASPHRTALSLASYTLGSRCAAATSLRSPQA